MSTRLNRWIAGLLVAMAVTGALVVARQSPEARRSADFTVLYSAAVLIRQGQPESVYDQASLAAIMREVTAQAPADPRLPFDYPLAAALPFVPLTMMSPEPAFRTWQVLSLALAFCMLLVLQRAVPVDPRAPWWAMLALLGAAPTWAVLTEGQFTVLLLSGAVLVIAAAAGGRRWLGAGVGAALLALKPQYLPAFLVLLWTLGRWKALGAGLAGGAATMASSLLAGGPAGFTAMVHEGMASAYLVPLRLSESWVGTLAALLPLGDSLSAGLPFFAFSLLILLILALRRFRSFLALGAVTGTLCILGSPRTLPHDLLLLTVPAWLAFALERRGQLPTPMPALALVQLAILFDLHGAPLTLTPLALTGLLGAYSWMFRRREAALSPELKQRAA